MESPRGKMMTLPRTVEYGDQDWGGYGEHHGAGMLSWSTENGIRRRVFAAPSTIAPRPTELTNQAPRLLHGRADCLQAQAHEECPSGQQWLERLLLAEGLQEVERTHAVTSGSIICFRPFLILARARVGELETLPRTPRRRAEKTIKRIRSQMTHALVHASQGTIRLRASASADPSPWRDTAWAAA